jgi:hypothetical protein
MPVTFLKNDKGIFKNVTSTSGINNQVGWWNTLAPGDFDNDGDIDYIAGNVGENSFYKATDQYPVGIMQKTLITMEAMMLYLLYIFQQVWRIKPKKNILHKEEMI